MTSDKFFVVSSARKLFLVPQAGAPIVEFPDGVIVSPYGAANETPSIVVCNGSEDPPSWQGVNTETGGVLVNEVPEEIAENALTMLESGASIEAVLYYLYAQGCTDQYTTNWGFFDKKLSPAGRVLEDKSGVYKRDDRDLTPCWREGDEYYVAHGDESRLIQPDILKRTYRMPNGDEIDLNKIPKN